MVGVSGGADSVALLRALVAVAGTQRLRLTAGHIDHGLRGEDSYKDAAWVEQLCEEVGVACDVVRVDTGGDESEQAARSRRYEALAGLARRHDCRSIAVAHTRNDQVETVLHHVVRGTGLSGLSGMPERQVFDGDLELIRPFLQVSRQQIVDWLSCLGQGWCEDASNRQTRWTRNRIRHELIPTLERDYNPQVREAVLRLAQLSREAEEIVSAQVEMLLDSCVLEKSECVVRVSVAELAGKPEPLIRACLKQLWGRLGWPRQGMGFDQWRRLAEVVGDRTATDLPGQVVARREGSVLRIECRTVEATSADD